MGGTVDVTVTGPGGTSAVSPADEFTYIVSSSTYSISLAASTTAPAVGGSVTLTATANKDIGPTPYGMSIVDASTGVIVSHVGLGLDLHRDRVAVLGDDAAVRGGDRQLGRGEHPGELLPGDRDVGRDASARPTVSAVSPASGAASGGTAVTITGTGFAAGDTVSFGGSAATGVTVSSATSITATSPAGSGTVDVTVTGPGGTSATSSADQFTYAPGGRPRR